MLQNVMFCTIASQFACAVLWSLCKGCMCVRCGGGGGGGVHSRISLWSVSLADVM
jgi:hypothetical protein